MNGRGPSEGHFLGLLTSVAGGLGLHHETQLPERILQSEDDRCVMVGCFAVGGASVEAYIRMLGCSLTIEPASQMNWAVGDRKISINNNNKKNSFRDTRLQDVHDAYQQQGKVEREEACCDGAEMARLWSWTACGHYLVVESPEFIRLYV